MESSDIQVCQTQVRKVIQDVLMLLWCENGIIPKKPTPELSFVPEITPEFLNDLFVVVWIESSCNEYKWKGFLKKHFKRLTITPYLFATYLAHAGYTATENATDIYGCFVGVLSLVSHFTLQYWQEKEDRKFLNCCVELFCAFFNKELCPVFEEQGSWKKFKEYLEKHGNLLTYKMFKSENKSRNEILTFFLKSYRDSKEPFVINGVTLKDITEDEVESNEKAVSFADSVGELLKEVCNKEFEEVLKDFQKTDNEMEKLYQKMVGAADGGKASAEDPSISQEVLEKTSESVPSDTNPVESEDLRRKDNPCDPSNIPVTDSLKSQDQTNENSNQVPPQDSYLIPKENVERAKALLEEMKKDIEKMSELVKFMCKENSIKIPEQVVSTKK